MKLNRSVFACGLVSQDLGANHFNHRAKDKHPSPHPPLEDLGIQRPNHALASLIEILFLSSLDRGFQAPILR
jgi:hypothetical protein